MAKRKTPAAQESTSANLRHDLIVGVDPGASGGVCVMRPGGEVVAVFKLPVTAVEMREVLRPYVDEYDSPMLFVELVQPHPGKVRSGMHKLMKCAGALEGVAVTLGFAFREVPPAVWQRKHNCLTKGDKNVSKAKAMELFPKHKITLWSADAMLIADYGRMLLVEGKV